MHYVNTFTVHKLTYLNRICELNKSCLIIYYQIKILNIKTLKLLNYQLFIFILNKSTYKVLFFGV